MKIQEADRSERKAEAPAKSCFGTIFPDVTQIQFGRPATGKVFTILVDTIGPGQRTRKLETDEAAWDDCRACDDFQNCYEFSMAKLQMQRVLITL